jgi:hypothetical protein
MTATAGADPAIPHPPAELDAAEALPRFRAFLEHYFFQGIYLDDAGSALLASIDDAERRWFREVLDTCCAIMEQQQRRGPADLLRRILARDCPWIDGPAMSRLTGAVAFAMR